MAAMQRILSFLGLLLLVCPPASPADRGYLKLFAGTGKALTAEDKRDMYRQLQLTLAKDGRQFVLGGCPPAELQAAVLDLNADGLAEVIVTGGNLCTSGATGGSIWLFIKGEAQGYEMHFGFPAHGYELLEQKHGGFPDIAFSGPGFCVPVWRWNGKTYVHAFNRPTAPDGCLNS